MEQLDPSAGEFLVSLYLVLVLIMSSICFVCWNREDFLNVTLKVIHLFLAIASVLGLLYRFGVIQLNIA